MKPDNTKPEKLFATLHDKLRQLERSCNPFEKNLHFNQLQKVDPKLFADLLSLSMKGLELVQENRDYFLNHALYDDGMYWYELCMIISFAVVTVKKEGIQSTIPDDVMRGLVRSLVLISEYALSPGGDMIKRNYEALGNTLWAFHSEELVEWISESAQKSGSEKVADYVEGVIEKINQILASEKTAESNLD